MPKKKNKRRGKKKGGAKGVKRADSSKEANTSTSKHGPSSDESARADEHVDRFALRKVTIHQPGDGKTRPRPGDVVVVHYIGSLTNGEMFDSSVKKGAHIFSYMNTENPF